MDKKGQNLPYKNEHPPREQFVMYLDGELSKKENQRWKSHLAACWECRAEIGKTEETIADIMEFENTLMKGLVSEVTKNTDDFRPRLLALAAKSAGAQDGRRFGWLRGLFSAWTSLMFQNRFGRLATASLACLLVVGLVFQLMPERVSASELYRKSNSSLNKLVLGVTKPIVYQKVEVAAAGKDAIVETWNDLEGKRTKRKTEDDADSKQIFGQFVTLLSKNGFDTTRPLSSEAFQQWSNALPSKTEEIAKTSLADGSDAYRLTISNGTAPAAGVITKASLVFRKSDWHPVSGSVSVRTANGDESFEIAEQKFRVIQGVFIKDKFFADGQ